MKITPKDIMILLDDNFYLEFKSTIMKKYIGLFLFIFLIASSCEYFKKNKEEVVPRNYDDTEEIDYTETAPVEEPLADNEVYGTYDNVRVKSKYTEYDFIGEDGNKFTVTVNHIQDKEGLEPLLPYGMLQGDKKSINPNMKGKTFILVKDLDGAIREVREK